MRNLARQCLDIAESILGDQLSKLPASEHLSLYVELYLSGQQSCQSEDLKAALGDMVDLPQTPSNLLALLRLSASFTTPKVAENNTDLKAALKQVLQAHLSPSDKDDLLKKVLKSLLKTYVQPDHLVQPDLELLLRSFEKTSTRRYLDPDGKACFDLEGLKLLCLLFHALSSHSQFRKREEFLSSLRPYFDKYTRIIGNLAAIDGFAFIFGRQVGVFTQLYPIELMACAFQQNWVQAKELPFCLQGTSKLFQRFFLHYFDPETGQLNSQAYRGFSHKETPTLVSLEVLGILSRLFCLAHSLNLELKGQHTPFKKKVGRFITFHKTQRKEHGLFFYYNPANGLKLTLPLVGLGDGHSASSLAFPHCPPLMDIPTGRCLPNFVPHLHFGNHIVTPSIYGKHCNLKLDSQQNILFTYRQPELISLEGKTLDIGESQINWLFADTFFASEFIFTLNKRATLNAFHYFVSESKWEKYPLHPPAHTLKTILLVDDFKTRDHSLGKLSSLPGYYTPYGCLTRIKEYTRSHPLIMRPNQPYVFKTRFDLEPLA